MSPTSRRRVADALLTLSETFGTPTRADAREDDLSTPTRPNAPVRCPPSAPHGHARLCTSARPIAGPSTSQLDPPSPPHEHARLSTSIISGGTSARPITGPSISASQLGPPSPPHGHGRISTSVMSGCTSASGARPIRGPSTSQLGPPPHGHARLSNSIISGGTSARPIAGPSISASQLGPPSPPHGHARLATSGSSGETSHGWQTGETSRGN